MVIRKSLWVLFSALGIAVCASAQAQEGYSCLSEEQAELLEAVNEYREQNSLPPVPWSVTLTQVGQYHVQDAVNNGSTLFNGTCNLHSWSSDQPQLWQGGCYTSDHANPSIMWDKPREISGGAFRGNGYELAASGYISLEAALEGWKRSSGHNTVMLNQGVWNRFTWRSMGVGVTEGRYYFLWFSDTADYQPQARRCDGPLFTTGFEDRA